MSTDRKKMDPVRLVIGFAAGSIGAALLGAGFFGAILVGVLGSIVAHFWESIVAHFGG
jgi:uncharacterized membrane protein YeaQ/YmgE (transglycosylase-associated protein family)